MLPNIPGNNPRAGRGGITRGRAANPRARSLHAATVLAQHNRRLIHAPVTRPPDIILPHHFDLRSGYPRGVYLHEGMVPGGQSEPLQPPHAELMPYEVYDNNDLSRMNSPSQVFSRTYGTPMSPEQGEEKRILMLESKYFLERLGAIPEQEAIEAGELPTAPFPRDIPFTEEVRSNLRSFADRLGTTAAVYQADFGNFTVAVNARAPYPSAQQHLDAFLQRNARGPNSGPLSVLYHAPTKSFYLYGIGFQNDQAGKRVPIFCKLAV